MSDADALVKMIERLMGPHGRKNRAEIMGELIRRGASAESLLILQAPNAYVAEVQGEVGDTWSLPYLRRCLVDPRPSVRRKAADAVVRIVERCESGALDRSIFLNVALWRTLPALRRLAAGGGQGAELLARPYQDALERLSKFLRPPQDLVAEYPIPSMASPLPDRSLPLPAGDPDREEVARGRAGSKSAPK